jgi:hypothetical protein
MVKRISNYIRTYIYSVSALVIILIVLVGILVHMISQDSALSEKDLIDISTKLERDSSSLFVGIRDNLSAIVDTYGIDGAMALTDHSFVNDKIGIYQCHVLMHSLGHEAVSYFDLDFEEVLKRESHFCELGYRHGAEAQVVVYGGDYIENIQNFCRQLKETNPSAGCYHGAGHEFMNSTLSVERSLELCDGLTGFADEDIPNCYNAVFAELTNLVGGTDGSTGVPYTNGPPLTLGADSPIAYCSQFDVAYRYQCIFEFSGLGVNENSQPREIEQKLRECINGEYDLELEGGCIKSVAAVGAQHELAYASTITFHSFILDLPETLRHAYIQGAGTELSQYLISGASRDWQSFCDNFTQAVDIEKCTVIFQD